MHHRCLPVGTPSTLAPWLGSLPVLPTTILVVTSGVYLVLSQLGSIALGGPMVPLPVKFLFTRHDPFYLGSLLMAL